MSPIPSSVSFASSASIENLKTRAKLLRQLREFFDDRGFFEVQTPVLSRYSIIDRHLDPIVVPTIFPWNISATSIDLPPSDFWYLQTSPEQSMKRLLASDSGSIYQVGPVFRAGEIGTFHNAEFTMAEWYDVGAGHERGLALLDELLQTLLQVKPARRVDYADAFRFATHLEIFEMSTDDLAEWCVREGLVDDRNWTDEWDEWLNLIFSERIQPNLGWNVPVLITHFPASQAALAKVSETDPRVSERYEIFYRGVELANGYHELTDANKLLHRAHEANQLRISDGKLSLPVENPVIDAMRHGLPECCGCALGFDRVVMLACNAKQLSEVLALDSNRS